MIIRNWTFLEVTITNNKNYYYDFTVRLKLAIANVYVKPHYNIKVKWFLLRALDICSEKCWKSIGKISIGKIVL